ncbi:MAG: cytochrome C assembly protein [Myxococcales bacterium]|nr:cytochrome C assembly protein [Myxococcales bacterium]
MKRTIFLAAGALAAVGFALLPFFVFFRAELAYDLYFNQKIFYYHVPAAFMMFLSVFICGFASAKFLISRQPRWDDVAAAAGDLVVLFGALVLTSGPIWGKAAWGQYWVWDARLTTSLLLWMIFVAYALLRRFGGPGSERLAAGLALFGTADVPLVYFAVNFWKTQHPTNRVVPNLVGEMRTTFLIGAGAYLCFFLILLAARIALGRSERRLAEVEDLAVEIGRLE